MFSSITERVTLDSIFYSIQKDCQGLKGHLDPPSLEELKEAAAIKAHNLELEALLCREQELLNSSPLFKAYLEELKGKIKKNTTQPNGVYFAYARPSPDSENEEGWIQDPFLTTLKIHLEQAGIETVKMDVVSNRIGNNTHLYMAQIQTDMSFSLGVLLLKKSMIKALPMSVSS